MKEFKTAYVVRLNGKGKGSIQYINDPCEICGEQHEQEI